MLILRAQLITGVKQKLLVRGQAADLPPTQHSDSERHDRILEVQAPRVALDAMALRIESHWMHVDPTLASCSNLYAQWQPVRLDRVAEVRKGRHASAEIFGVNGQV